MELEKIKIEGNIYEVPKVAADLLDSLQVRRNDWQRMYEEEHKQHLNIIDKYLAMKKEPQEPQMTRMPKSLKEDIKASAKKHNEGNFNKEVRDLIQIGLKNRKSGGHLILTESAKAD